MSNLTKGTLFSVIHNYLKIYLPKQRSLSAHTIRSYTNALELLVDYIRDVKLINLIDVTFEMMTSETIIGYLDYLENERGCSTSTRNIRRAAINSFFVYAATQDIASVVYVNEMKNVPMKKPHELKTVEYMSMSAISTLFEQPDTSTLKGLRDRFFMMLMYDLGARIQEMINITLQDLHIGKISTIIIHGKGNKTRSVPIMEKTVEYLREYLEVFHPDSDGLSPLFYIVANEQRNPISASCVRLFLSQYGKAAHNVNPEVPENVHPHLWRHSRAMHLYQQGMDLTLVSQWLGHAQLETTRIYAYADTEQKRKAITAATPSNSPLGKRLSPERFTITDEDVLKRLSGLK